MSRLKSLSRSVFIPGLFLNSRRDGVASTEIGRISTPCPAKRSKSSLKHASSFVHVPVNASGKNANSTFLFPRKDDSVTSLPDVDAAVKSGATSPTCGEFCSCVLVIAIQKLLRHEWNQRRKPPSPQRRPASSRYDVSFAIRGTASTPTR